MQRAVPGRLEAEHGPVVAGDLEDLAREEAEGEDGAVLVVVDHAVWRGADPPDHQLPHVAPAEVGSLVDDGEPDPALEAVMEA